MKTLTSGPSTYQPEKPARARHGAVPAAFCAALLVLQPVVFFWHVLVNPRWHIPYDIEGFHLPLIAYVAQCVRNGVAPLWDPYVMCGMPIHADLQAQVFYPFTWLAILAGNLSQGRNLFYWVETLVPLHMILAGLFAFWLLRRMGLGRPAALMGASVYQLGGYFASQAQHLCAISTGAWLPLAILCAWELRLRVKWRWVAVLALTMAMAILSGFAATAVIVGVAVLFFMGALFVTREADWRMIPGVGLGCLAGAAIAAVELVPLWTLTNSSIASLRADWYLFGGGLPLASLVSLVLPDYFHIFEFPSLYRAPYQFTFLYTYCGIATVILLAAALFVRQARAIVFLALTVISAVWMLGENTPVYRSIFPHLPRLLRGALYPEYALMAFCFFAAITAAVVYLRKLPYLAVGWFFYLIAMVPVIGIVQVGFQGMADRYTYVPAIGLLIALVWGLSEMVAQIPVARAALALGGLCVVIGLVAVSARYLECWKDPVSLFARARTSWGRPDFWLEQLYGNALFSAGRTDEALEHYQESCTIQPRTEYCHYNIAHILAGRRQYSDALHEYQLALRYTASRDMALICLDESGEALLQMGDYDAAQKAITQALGIDPADSMARHLQEVASHKGGAN